jgi:hypothetical protein
MWRLTKCSTKLPGEVRGRLVGGTSNRGDRQRLRVMRVDEILRSKEASCDD